MSIRLAFSVPKSPGLKCVKTLSEVGFLSKEFPNLTYENFKARSFRLYKKYNFVLSETIYLL
jgi:hypothetical protein